MRVNICGVPHEVIFKEDAFTGDATHFGEIDYAKAQITINNDMGPELRTQTLCHEMLHGILVHLGYVEQSQDEQFVQCLAQAIAQSFKIAVYDESCRVDFEKLREVSRQIEEAKHKHE